MLRIVVTNDKGVEVTHYFLSENQFCTILASFNNGLPADESIQAACNAEVLAITRTGLLALYEKISYLKELIDQITQQRLLDSSISLTSGIASSRSGKGWSVASSVCGAMEGFTRAMAVELAPIRVNCVVPSVVKTNLWNSLPEKDRENLYSAVGDSLLVKRVGEAEDIARAFLYLIKQTFGTGQCLVVDGGTALV